MMMILVGVARVVARAELENVSECRHEEQQQLEEELLRRSEAE